MSGPKVTAVVTAEDRASDTLRKLGALMKRIAQEMDKPAKGTSTLDAVARAHDQAAAAATRHLTALQKLGGMTNRALGAASPFIAAGSAGVARQAWQVGTAVAGAMDRMVAFNNASEESAAQIAKMANTNLAGLRGGPVASAQAARAAGQSGINVDDPESVKTVLRLANVYAEESNQALPQAVDELIQFTSIMQKNIDSKTGKLTPLGQLSGDDLKKSMQESLGFMLMSGKLMPGSFRDTFNFARYAAPVLKPVGVNDASMLTLQAAMAFAGIKAEEAGNAARSIAQRLFNPTQKGGGSIAAVGMKWSDYAKLDNSAMNGEAFNNYLRNRVGATKAGTAEKADKIIKQLREDGNYEKARDSLAALGISQGAKNLKDKSQASKFAQQYLSNFVKDFDFNSMLMDAHKRGVGPAFLGNLLGIQQGSRAAALLSDSYFKIMQRVNEELNKKSLAELGAKAPDEWEKTFTARLAEMQGKLKGAYGELFRVQQNNLQRAMDAPIAILDKFGGLSDLNKQLVGVGIAGAGLYAGVRTLVTISKFMKGIAALSEGVRILPAAASEVAKTVALNPTRAPGFLGGVSAFFRSPLVRALGGVGAGVSLFQQYDDQAKRQKTTVGVQQTLVDRAMQQIEELEKAKRALGAETGGRQTALRRLLGLGPGGSNLEAHKRLDELITRARADMAVAASLQNPFIGSGQITTSADPKGPRSFVLPGTTPVGPGAIPAVGDGMPSWFVPFFARNQSQLPLNGTYPFPEVKRAPPALDEAMRSISVEGTVTGKVELVQSFTIEPSPLFLSRMAERAPVSINVDGKLGSTMRGSNAAATPVGSIGSSGGARFAPTLSGL